MDLHDGAVLAFSAGAPMADIVLLIRGAMTQQIVLPQRIRAHPA